MEGRKWYQNVCIDDNDGVCYGTGWTRSRSTSCQVWRKGGRK